MKRGASFDARVVLAALLVALAGCGTGQGGMQQRDTRSGMEGSMGGGGMTRGSQSGGMMHGSEGGSMMHRSEGGSMEMMDMKSMCEMHAAMAGKSKEEKQAMMLDQAGPMSAQAMQEHMKMMESHCKQ